MDLAFLAMFIEEDDIEPDFNLVNTVGLLISILSIYFNSFYI